MVSRSESDVSCDAIHIQLEEDEHGKGEGYGKEIHQPWVDGHAKDGSLQCIYTERKKERKEGLLRRYTGRKLMSKGKG